MNPLTWIKRHPFQAIAFTVVFTFIATFAGAVHMPWQTFAEIDAVPMMLWLCVVWRDHGKVL